MLFYNPPFLMVDQVTIYPDHADPETYYYSVATPDLVVEAGEPAFWATAILPPVSAGTATAGQQDIGRALVSFDVCLPLPPDPDGRLRKEIQKRWGREPKRLVPAPLRSGKVSLTVARPGAAEPDKEFFVYEGHAPSLLGDNRAALAIAAEGKEAQALVAAMTAGHLAGVVTYELEMLGLAPTFNARMTVSWSKVYERFRKREIINAVFFQKDIDETIEKLKESQSIVVDVQELDPDGARGAARALFDELKGEVMKKLFDAPRPGGDQPIEERIGRGVREVLTSVLPGASFSLMTLDQRFLSDTVIELREQQVKSYRVYPQSTPAGLLRRGGNAAERLTFVRIEDLPHRVEEIFVDLAGGADKLGVRSVLVHVQVHSPGREAPLLDEKVTLTSAAPGRRSVRFRRLDAATPLVKYQIEMMLDPAVAPGGRERWTFDWQPVLGNRIWVDPEEWLDVAEVRFEIDDPAVFEASRVDMEVEASVLGQLSPARKVNLRFGPDALSHTVSIVVPDDGAAKFRATEQFRRVGETDFVRVLPELTSAVHRIMNPFGQSWTMDVRAVSSWVETSALFAEFRVWDVLRRTWLRAEQQFHKASPSFTFRFATSLETPRKAEVRVTRVMADGTLVRGAWKDLVGPVAAISDEVKPERRIRATLAAPQFVRLGVKKVSLELEYHDEVHGLHATADPPLEFVKDASSADWTHRFLDPAQSLFKFKLRARGSNGERYTGRWQDSAADDLTLTLPDDLWSAS